ncbi:tumor susceptibility gene 101 protein-like, partial [Saccostrea echinata]|uniref:tumor susceptibility gene 101 protein-like n=1 Tax=Saccostrea echinata TaxID=191078 RepID=UPI002A7EE712
MAGSSVTDETTQALSQYKYADIAKRDIMNAISQFKDLRPELERFYFGDGTKKNLLNLNGTIPVNYEGNEYNIPIIVWILDTHPYNSPMVYVKPYNNMYIKANRNVDSNGNVNIPYLRDWRYPQSDLLGLIQILIKVFGEEPPLYSSSVASQQRHQVQSEHLS